MDSKIYDIKFVDEIPTDVSDENVLLLRKLALDTVGTTSGAVWVKAYGKYRDGKTALYKPLDYDEPFGAQAELISSHFDKLCLDGIKVRIPEINLVGTKNDLGILSYRVHDKTSEDFIHIDYLLRYKYTDKEISKFYTLGIKDVLECIKAEVAREDNYKEIEKAVIMVACADAFTNNADRHGKNWALIRNKDTDYYELAIFDNVKSFINIMFNRTGYANDALWSIGYLGLNSSCNISTGKNIVDSIKKEYPEYVDEFIERFNSVRKQFCEDIKDVYGVDSRRIKSFFSRKSAYFDKEMEMDW